MLADQEAAVSEHPSVSAACCRQQQTTDCILDSTQVSGCEHEGFTALHLHSVLVGELPPPPPRACFGRNGLIGKVVELAENLKPLALIGAGGIGKTSIALKVLHHDRIKKRFGDNRRFIRCDQFLPSAAHLLSRLSKVIGAGVENPEDLTPLRPSLSASEMILFLDNAESILDPAGQDAREIYAIVEELTRFDNICIAITSRISTIPPSFQCLIVPALAMESACNIFYNIYNNGGRSDIIRKLVKQLDFHALSITLLATVASRVKWGYDRLAKEWETQRAQVFRENHNQNLARTIEFSLGSQKFHKPTPSSLPFQKRCKRLVPSIFHKLIPSSMSRKFAPSARELLELVAFFPQGIDEKNLDWLFPTVPDRRNIFDQFCSLSLTYRSDGFIRMLAPIRDYLGPQDPKSSPLLCATKKCYFRRLSVIVGPGLPGFKEAEWIASEDINVEHLIDVFMAINPKADDIWTACYHFMQHLEWHKPRPTVLGPKVEALPDGHPFKAKCLIRLSQLFRQVGNHAEEKRVLMDTLKLVREKGDKASIAQVLRILSIANGLLRHHKEGTEQAREAVKILEQRGNRICLARSLVSLAFSLSRDYQLDAATDAASRAIRLALGKDQHIVCQSHQILGQIYHCKGERGQAIRHFETAFEIASCSNWHFDLFWIHYNLATVFCDESNFGEANTHIERAKPHTANHPYNGCSALEGQAQVWYRQGRFEEAKSEALCAIESLEKLGITEGVERCRRLLRKIERAMKHKSTTVQPSNDGELL